MFASRQRKTVCVPSCQPLENRLFLNATLLKGVLKVVGTEGDDDIAVLLGPGAAPDQLVVNINGSVTTFQLPDVHRLEIYGLAGEDHLLFDNHHSFGLSAFMNGGRSGDL